MYNYKYYRYQVFLYGERTLFAETYAQRIKLYPSFDKIISENIRNYAIDKLNKFGEYEIFRYDACAANVINLDRKRHKILLCTTRCTITGIIKIIVEYWIEPARMKRADIFVDHLVPISQL